MTSIERAYQWKEEGRIHVSPHEAAEVLDADPYTLNICARVMLQAQCYQEKQLDKKSIQWYTEPNLNGR